MKFKKKITWATELISPPKRNIVLLKETFRRENLPVKRNNASSPGFYIRHNLERPLGAYQYGFIYSYSYLFLEKNGKRLHTWINLKNLVNIVKNMDSGARINFVYQKNKRKLSPHVWIGNKEEFLALENIKWLAGVKSLILK